ncbi:unnamed protein product [Boreogadus saida]
MGITSKACPSRQKALPSFGFVSGFVFGSVADVVRARARVVVAAVVTCQSLVPRLLSQGLLQHRKSRVRMDEGEGLWQPERRGTGQGVITHHVLVSLGVVEVVVVVVEGVRKCRLC